MKKVLFITRLVIITTGLILSACSNDNDPVSANSDKRKVKYEITGNFSGKFDVFYSDNVNQITHVTGVTLPWSLEVQYGSDVMTIGIGAQATVTGTPGQTATAKIYSNGVVVKTSSGTAGSLGEMIIPTVAFGF